MRSLFDTLQERASVALAAEGFAEEDRVFHRSADLRYFGQAFEVRVPVAAAAFDASAARAAAEAFHDGHERLYGYCFRDKPQQRVEWVNLRVTGIGPIQRPRLPPLPAGAGARPAPTGTRGVCFDAAGGFTATAIYWRDDLPPGAVVAGPAVIEEYGATVPVHPGFAATVDHLGNLVLQRRAP